MFKEVFAEQLLKVEKEMMRQGQYPNPEVWQNTIILLRNVRERLANIKREFSRLFLIITHMLTV
ncbi:hypothetical protein AGMMS49953_09300 [Endomicrobiia bacterium]|nr:hypothetical protein AGMMS49953_09300 [Endomicrobiia bacterium]